MYYLETNIFSSNRLYVFENVLIQKSALDMEMDACVYVDPSL